MDLVLQKVTNANDDKIMDVLNLNYSKSIKNASIDELEELMAVLSQYNLYTGVRKSRLTTRLAILRDSLKKRNITTEERFKINQDIFGTQLEFNEIKDLPYYYQEHLAVLKKIYDARVKKWNLEI